MKRLLLVTCMASMGNLVWAQSAPPLGSAKSFAVLGAATVTNSGPTVITGDVGVSPGTSITGFPPGIVLGGALHPGDAAATAAHADASTAYSDLVAEPCGTNLSGLTLGTSPGAVTLAPGVYCFASSAQLTGTLTLSGSGVYIFQMGSTFTSATAASVVLANGATGGNVFWQVGSSATLGTGTALAGTFIAASSVTVTAGTQALGRVFALSGAVTMDTNTIVSPVNQQFIIESIGDAPSAGFATSNNPNATQQCSVDAPCPQQLEIAFDTLNQQPATLGNPNDIFATNSLDDPDVISQIVITNPCVAATPTAFTAISVLNEDNTYYNFFLSGDTGNGINPCLANSSSPASGNYCLGPDNGDCANETESGGFTIYAMPDPSAVYFGTFSSTSRGYHRAAVSGPDSLAIQANPDFSVAATLLMAPGDLCAAQTSALSLTSADPEAINYADYGNGISGIVVGDVVAVAVADDLGNVLAVFATDKDANGNALPPGSLDVSGTVISGVCGSGTVFYDKPFSIGKGPITVWRHRRLHHHWYITKYMHEFQEEIQNREQVPPARCMFPVLGW
ncbi:MAG TPA: ice-binding family protein [Candidatus Binatus sp.]|jgi:hypothetical protein|nr:ice-binding family protein [Candidatus Binatus sp.]